MSPCRGKVILEHSAGLSARGRPVLEVSQEENWMTPIVRYLNGDEKGLTSSQKAGMQRRASRYVLRQGELYKRSFSLPLLKCLGPEKAEYVLAEVHEGVCGNHSGGRALAQKIVHQGFYWPSMRKEATDYVRRCDKCQKFAKVPRLPVEELNVSDAPWPFAKWGIDLLGPFPPATGQRKFLIVACDYFTKWVRWSP